MKWVINAKYEKDFKIKVTFNTKETFTIDFKKHLDGPIFEKLKNVKKFQQFSIHPELNVLCWPNGADFSSDFLYDIAKKKSNAA